MKLALTAVCNERIGFAPSVEKRIYPNAVIPGNHALTRLLVTPLRPVSKFGYGMLGFA
jgi:hypothetical protein